MVTIPDIMTAPTNLGSSLSLFACEGQLFLNLALCQPRKSVMVGSKRGRLIQADQSNRTMTSLSHRREGS